MEMTKEEGKSKEVSQWLEVELKFSKKGKVL